MKTAGIVLVSALWVGCGGAPEAPQTPGGDAEGSSAPSAESHAATGAKKRLQGTWEIVRYVSNEPIPPEAMPLLAELFESVRLTFQGDTVEAGGEKVTFRVEDERDDEFHLAAKGGMFDGATCRFVSADELEVIDTGPAWPGTSLLRRVP